MATFFWARRDRGEQEVESFQGNVLRIGRGTNAELRFVEKTIDLEHASISFDDNGYLLRDLHSATGVWVNGERVRSVRLRDGDAIEIGGYRLKVKWQEALDPLFLDVESLAFDPELSTVIHTFKASSNALVVLAELEAQRRARDPFEVSTYIEKVLPDLPASDAALLTRMLPVQPRPVSEGFTELLKADRDPKPGLGALPLGAPLFPGGRSGGHGGAPPLAVPSQPAPRLAAPPPVPFSAQALPAISPTGAAAPAQVGTGKSPARRGRMSKPIDYAGAYLLPALRGKFAVALLAVLATGLFFFQLFESRGGQMFAPGPLAPPHASTVKTCGDCHSGFRPVSDLSCRTSCHSRVADHQSLAASLEAGKPACTDCHTEHHGGEALALFSRNTCADCHGSLEERLPSSVFANRVTDFESNHPEFAIDTPNGRRRLSDPDGRLTDPGGLVNFDHAWHLNKLPVRARRDCADCHARDPKSDEILGLDFEASCRSCHSLPFDPRFPGQQVPHKPPREVFDFLVGTYLRNPQILGRLDANERVVASASLSREQQLAKVAQLVGERVLRISCTKCHRFLTPEKADQGKGEAIVAPVKWRAPYFLHARFSHAPHLRIADCQECHAEASTSRKSEDLLLPGIAACQTCHRRAASAKVDKSKIGEAHCLNCHSYHPTQAELLASRSPS